MDIEHMFFMAAGYYLVYAHIIGMVIPLFCNFFLIYDFAKKKDKTTGKKVFNIICIIFFFAIFILSIYLAIFTYVPTFIHSQSYDYDLGCILGVFLPVILPLLISILLILADMKVIKGYKKEGSVFYKKKWAIALFILLLLVTIINCLITLYIILFFLALLTPLGNILP